MADTTRTILQIIVNMDESGSVQLVEAYTKINQQANAITGSYGRQYRELYENLGPAAQGRVDDFVTDVGNFIDSQEPIV